MKQLRRIPIALPRAMPGKQGVVLAPGESLALNASIKPLPWPARYRLRVVGLVGCRHDVHSLMSAEVGWFPFPEHTATVPS